MAVWVNKSLSFWCIRFFDVPASDSITIDLCVEDDICLFIIAFCCWLGLGATITKDSICIIGITRCSKSFVLKNCVWNWELLCGCQSVEVNSTITEIRSEKKIKEITSKCYNLPMFICWFAQSHSKYAVSPLEVYTTDSQISLKRVKVEEVVLNTVRFVIFKVIYNNSIWTEIGKVSKSIATVSCLSIDNLKKWNSIKTKFIT